VTQAGLLAARLDRAGFGWLTPCFIPAVMEQGLVKAPVFGWVPE